MNREEIEERSRRIKQRAIEKARSGSTVYLGGALVVIMLLFVLYSNLPSGEAGNITKPVDKITEEKIKINLTIPAKEKPVKEETGEEAELSPPIPEDFNPEDLVKVAIVDDAQSAFWSNIEPTAVLFYDDYDDKKSGESSLRVRFINERKPWVFAEYTYPELEDWSGAKFISFWFKGNKTGLTFDFYVHFDKKMSNYVVFRIRDIYDGWQHFVFSTERNIIKNGEVDWSRVWKLRLVNNNRSYIGEFYFDDFTVWIPKEYYSEKETASFEENKTYGMHDTITINNLSVTLLRFRDRYTVTNFVGSKTYTEEYIRLDIRIENKGEKEIKLSLSPYKPILIDDKGRTYDYYYVKVRTPAGNWVPHPDQINFDVLYPGTAREGAIFFKPTPKLDVNSLRLILHLNGRKYEFNFSRW